MSDEQPSNADVVLKKKLNEHYCLTHLGYMPESKVESLKLFFDKNFGKKVQHLYEAEIYPETYGGSLTKKLTEMLDEFRQNPTTESARNYLPKKLLLAETHLKNFFRYCVHLESFSEENTTKIVKKTIPNFNKERPNILRQRYAKLIEAILCFIEIAKVKSLRSQEVPDSLLFVIYYLSDFISRHVEDQESKQRSIYIKLYAYSLISYRYFYKNAYQNLSDQGLAKWIAINFPDIKILGQNASKSKFLCEEHDLDPESMLFLFRMFDFLNHLKNIDKQKEPEKLQQAIVSLLSEANWNHITDMLKKDLNSWTTLCAAMTARMVAIELILSLSNLKDSQSQDILNQPTIKNSFKNLISFLEYEAESFAKKEGIDLDDPLELLFIADTSPEVFQAIMISKIFEVAFSLFGGEPLKDNSVVPSKPQLLEKDNATTADPKDVSYIEKTAENLHWFFSPTFWYNYFVSLFCPPKPEDEEAISSERLMDSAFIKSMVLKSIKGIDEEKASNKLKKTKWYAEIKKMDAPKDELSDSSQENSFPSSSSSSSSSMSSYVNNEKVQDDPFEQKSSMSREKFEPKISKRLQKYYERSQKANTSPARKVKVSLPVRIFHDKICYRHIPNADTHHPLYAGVSPEMQAKIIDLMKEKGKDKINHPKMTRSLAGQGIKKLTDIEQNKVRTYFDEEYTYKLKFLGSNGKKIRFLGKKFVDPKHLNTVFILFDQEVDHDLKPIKNKRVESSPYPSVVARVNIFEEARRRQTRNSDVDNSSNSTSSDYRKNLSQ